MAWPAWPVVYGRSAVDVNGDPLLPDVFPPAPEIFRLEATGGLLFEPGDFGYARVSLSDGAAARFKVDDLDHLANYIADFARRMRLQRKEA